MYQRIDRPVERRGPVRVVVAACWLAAVGCGGPAYEYDAVVTGTVTVEGELAPRGTITFHPIDKAGKIAIGRIYPDGSFALRTGQGDLRVSDGGTVVPGEYIVTIVVTGPPPAASSPEGGPPGSGPLLTAKRYISRDTSDLRCEVKPGENVVVFDVERAVAEETASDDVEGESAESGEAEDAAAEGPAVVPDDNDDDAAPAAAASNDEGATP